MTSYDVRIYAIETRKGRTIGYRVRWTVAGKRFGETFAAKGLAESYRAALITAPRRGEAFSTDTGLPESLEHERRDVSFYAHCLEFAGVAWPMVSARSRGSIVESLLCVIPVVVSPNGAAPPDPNVLRAALRKKLNQGTNGGVPDLDENRALTWIAKASRPVSALGDPSVAADVLDALARKLDGSPASPPYFSRRRRVVHRTLGYAVRKKRLSANPLSKAAQPEGWTPPEPPDDALDYRTIGSPELVESMIETCCTLGTTQGARFRAFYGCMYFSMMRPSEVAALKLSACELPEDGWGWLTIADASTTAGRAYTDDGRTHEHRGLKGRTRGRPSTRARKPSRRIPAPPELVAMLREHITRFGAGPDGRIFRSERGNPIQASTWWSMAEGPGRLAHSRAARRAAHDPALLPAARRSHPAAQRGRRRGHRRRVGRALGRSPAPHLPSLGRRPGRDPDRADGRAPEAVVMGTHWGRNPASGRHRLAQRCHRLAPSRFASLAGERPAGPGHDMRPQQDSNLRTRLRRPMLYPLSYGGCATWERVSAASPPRTLSRGHANTRARTRTTACDPSRAAERLPSRS